MTIRQRLLKTQRKLFLWALLFWLFPVVGSATGNAWIIAPAFVAFMSVAVAQFFVFRCPRCRGNLSTLQLHFGSTWSMAKKARFCPFCATDLDSEIS